MDEVGFVQKVWFAVGILSLVAFFTLVMHDGLKQLNIARHNQNNLITAVR